MKIDALTTFPAMYDSVMGSSMMRIAQEKSIIDFTAYDLRDWTYDRHRSTDDDPYGGGAGLVMKCEPIFEAYDALTAQASSKPFTLFLSPAGEPFSEELAVNLAQKDHLLFICGHYEGIDERAYQLADQVISLGDYVLTSGELASMVVIDAVVRKLEGVLGDAMSAHEESFYDGLLEYPQYTRPSEFRGMQVPEILLTGNHAAIEKWRHEQSLERTATRRPDLLQKALLSDEDYVFLNSLSNRTSDDAEALS